MNPTPEELRSRLRYEPETGLLYWREGEKFAGRRAFVAVTKRGYHATTFRPRAGKQTSLSAHRVAWAIFHGEWPSGQIDHISGSTRGRPRNQKGTQMNTRLPPGSAVILSALLGACVYVAVIWWVLG